MDISPIKRIPILAIANRLGISVVNDKAMCFSGHDSKSASLTFNSEKNLWKCFGACGRGGDNIELVKSVLEIGFISAVVWFEKNGFVTSSNNTNNISSYRKTYRNTVRPVFPKKVEIKREFLADSDIYGWLIKNSRMVSSVKGLEYLKDHGVSKDTQSLFDLREISSSPQIYKSLVEKWGEKRLYNSGLISKKNTKRLIWFDDAILFPFYESGNVIYIQARLLNSKIKYINPRGIEKPIFNIEALKKLEKGSKIFLCEGVPDALALESRGLSAVAILGASSFRSEWVDCFLEFKIIVVPDSDIGGAKFLSSIRSMFNARGVRIYSAMPPAGKDASDVIAKISKDE